jgi:hypothetical protein
MEGRTLLASTLSPTVQQAVALVEATRASGEAQVNAEVAALDANIAAIRAATSAFIADEGGSSPSLVARARRDEKFAVAQQKGLILAAGILGFANRKALTTEIRGLTIGAIAPTGLASQLDPGVEILDYGLGQVDAQGTSDREALLGTLRSGSA